MRHDYCRSNQVPARYPNLFTSRQWEWALRHRTENGIARAVRRIGRGMLVHLPTLLEVIERNAEEAES